jgi:lipid II isoglutaminyl synthase (glutamine-hydrolysing)
VSSAVVADRGTLPAPPLVRVTSPARGRRSIGRMQTAEPTLPLRTRVALGAGRLTNRLSMALGRGRGSVVGGRVMLRLDRSALPRLASGRTVAIVSATNGKSTTSRLLNAALRTTGDTAFNDKGANMQAGVTVALDEARDARVAVLEVDEAYLGPITSATRPRVITLMNLSRDYLERGVRTKKLVRHWDETLSAITWPCTVVANADDPLVCWAVRHAADVVWVAGGLWYRADASSCRNCFGHVRFDDTGGWTCAGCGRTRPQPVWTIDGDRVTGPGVEIDLDLRLPGRAVRSNALFALATAAVLGVPSADAVAAFPTVDDVDGRYGYRPFGDHEVRLILSKNSSSWTEVVSLLRDSDDPTVVVVEARGDDGGKDTGLIWDADLDAIEGQRVVCSGGRAGDIALRFTVAGAEVEVVPDVWEAIRRQPPGKVNVAANWPAFNAIRDELDRR